MILENLTEPEKHFKYDRNKAKLVKYLEAKSKPAKKLNKKARTTGVDITDVTNKKLRFHLITRDLLDLFYVELEMQGLVEGQDYAKTMGITKLKKILQKKLGLGDKAPCFDYKYQLLFDVANEIVGHIATDINNTLPQDPSDEDDKEDAPYETNNNELYLGNLKMKNGGVNLLRAELRAQGVSFDKKDSIKNLKTLLKEHIGNDKLVKFIPVSSEIMDAIRNGSIIKR